MRYLGASTGHFHNLTELARGALSEPLEEVATSVRRRGGSRLQDGHWLPNTVDAGSNVALFQLSAELPLAVDLVFTGSLPAEQVGNPAVVAPCQHHTCTLQHCRG